VKLRRIRSGLITATVILVAGAAWLFLAPTRIGGSTTYVVTSGISMQPRFHTGDLALVRPVDHYRVGMIVAYHSSLLKVVVLHRIHAIHDGHYVFKGDNNNFLDPVHPTRSQLVGALWLRLPHGGRLLKALHAKVTVILLCVFVGLLLIGGTEKKRRRGRRRRKGSTGSSPPKPMSRLRDNGSMTPSLRGLLTGVAAAAAGFLVVVGFANEHPTTKPATHGVPYSQKATFDYHATAPRGVVYPDGRVNTGDPIFLALVHRIGVKVGYQFNAPEASGVRGTEQLLLNLTGPSGWSRTVPLTPVRHFTGVQSSIATSVALAPIQALLLQVSKQTGMPGTYGTTIAITLAAHIHAHVAGQRVDQDYTGAQNFTLQPLQLQAAGAGGFAAKKGTVAIESTVNNPFHLLGATLSYSTLSRLGLLGFILCAAAIVPLAVLLRRNRAFDEAARIRNRYAHLLVPILIGEDLGWPPVDVTSFKALARLAESAGQLVLHHQADAVDTYLVNDNGTVYRYQISLPLVTWGEWTETNVAADPAALADAATALAEAAADAADDPAPADVPA
jgi:signal peptidase I